MSRRPFAWVALMVVCATSALVVYRVVHRPSLDDPVTGQWKVVPVSADELPEPVCTDKLRPIRLFRLSPQREPTSQEMRDARAEVEQRLSLVRTAPADEPCNCFGWVFANGEYWLAWQDAEAILEDNGYSAVNEPQPGDVVVYRNPYGILIHVGIVRHVDKTGNVRVESQWGEMGRYLHTVENQVFSDIFGYFRSKRHGHVLAGLDRESQSSHEIEE